MSLQFLRILPIVRMILLMTVLQINFNFQFLLIFLQSQLKFIAETTDNELSCIEAVINELKNSEYSAVCL